MNYAEQLAHEIFHVNPAVSTQGRCSERLDLAGPLMVRDLGRERAGWYLNCDQAFAGDFVGAYLSMQGKVVAGSNLVQAASKQQSNPAFRGVFDVI